VDSLVKRVISSVLGLVLVLSWWTFRGWACNSHEEVARMPEKVFGGSAGPVKIEVETSQRATMRASFAREKSFDRHESLDAHQELPPGKHTFQIYVEPETSVHVEVDVRDPEPGSSLSWTVRVGGQEVLTEDDRAEEPGWPLALAWSDDDASTPAND
jgi:hypothetical protein